MEMNAVLTGCVLFKDREVALFAFEPAGRANECVFRVLLGSQWHVFDVEPKWIPVGMAAARYPGAADFIIVASSSEGHIWELVPSTGDEHEGKIEGDYSGITKVTSIDDAVWACGMDRIVLRRDANGRWSNVSAPEANVDEGVIGFTALAQSAPGELVAVGWKGEIWLRSNDAWDRQDSGTRANFNAVSAGPDGQLVVVGDNGSIVVGRRDQWSVLDIDPDLNLQGVCHFADQVFISSDFELFRLEGRTLAPEARFADGDRPRTCMNLYAGKESVFSQGEKDIFRFNEGAWARVF
jgi:hypothetical protein